MYLQHILLKIRKITILKFTFSKHHVHCLYLIYTSQTANPCKNSSHFDFENCLYLQDSYISRFVLMNYLFANLLVAWLYKAINDELA